MRTYHVIENCDSQVIEIIARNAETALTTYVKHCKVFNDDTVNFERLSEQVFVATWNREWGF